MIGDSQAGTKDDILTNKKTEIRTTSSTPIGPGETFIIAPTGTLSGATNLVAMRDLASSNYNSATGKRYIALMTFDTDTGSYGDIVDMMGDATKGKGPYTGTGGVSSDNAAVTRLPSVLSFPRNRLTWDASEWKLEAPKVEITTTSEFTYFSYHISDTFVCAVNADCPPDALGAECISDRCIINDGLTVAPSPSPPLTPSPTIAPTTAPTTAAPTLPVTQAPTGDWYERPIFAGYVNSGGKVAIQIFNPSYNPMENNLYLLIGTSITTNPAEDAELIIELNFTESIPPGQSKVVSHGSAGAPLNMLGLNKAALSTVIGSSWLALSKNETGKLEILDVIGNPSTTGPWVDDASGVTTNGAAIKRKPTINIPDMSSPAWDANEWYFAEGEITSQSDFLYFRGHTQDNFVCKNHKSCSFNTFCAKGSQTCKSCDSCFADNDAFNNICPPRCRPLMFAGYVEDGMKKAVQIYNPNNVTVNLRDYTLLVERSTTTLKSSISPLWGKYESDHINITAGSTILLASMFAGTELHKFLEPSSLFQMSDWNAQFSFTGDDFLLLAAFEFGIEIVEKEFDDAYNDIYDRIDTIYDVIGSTIDSGPWVVNNEAGTEIFATRDYALKRNRTATRTYLGSYKDIYRDETRAELSGPYRWKPEEWYKAVDKKGDLDSSFDFFGYHMSDSFLCSKHEDCPDQWEDENGKISAGFCYKDRTCQLCSETELSKCVFDGDGIDGTCPSKCPQLCAGAIPMATCPQCRTKIPKPHTIGMESLDDSNEFILHWCSNETYHEVTPALSKRASANVTLTFYESDDPDSYAITDYFGHFSFNLTDRSTVKFSSESNMCSTSHPFEYSVHLKVTEPYTTASASLVLYDHCQLPKLTSKERATTMEAAPTWYRSKNTKNRADIIPYVAGSTSELVVLQWDMPLLNCEGCEVSDYTIFQSESDGDFKEEFSSSTSSNGTIRILRGLNTKIKYRYKVQAKTRVGNSKLSLSSSGFSPVAEPPDPPPLIYFSDINDTKVTVHVIKGDENGSPISEVSLLMYTMNETIRRNVTWDIDSFDSSIEIAGLEKDSPLHFTARLVNAAGISESSEVFKMKTDNPPCKYTDYELGEDIGCVEKDSAWIHGFDFRKRADARCKPLQREEYLALFSLSLNIPCEYLPLTSTEGKTVMSFSLLGITLCLAAAAFFAINSQKKIVKASQPVFMVNFFFVVSLSNTYGITMILPQSSFTLNLRLIIFNLSFALGVSLLNAKLFRVWKLFASKSARMLKKQRVTPRGEAGRGAKRRVHCVNIGIKNHTRCYFRKRRVSSVNVVIILTPRSSQMRPY